MGCGFCRSNRYGPAAQRAAGCSRIAGERAHPRSGQTRASGQTRKAGAPAPHQSGIVRTTFEVGRSLSVGSFTFFPIMSS
jgi:hypothetical protein